MKILMGKFVIYILFATILIIGGGVLMVWLMDIAEPFANENPECASEDCEFTMTSRNIFGSGNHWQYGYDERNYYSSIIPSNYSKDFVSVSKETANLCQAFDSLDVVTWVECGFLKNTDCDFVKLAKNNYENNSSATQDMGRYLGNLNACD